MLTIWYDTTEYVNVLYAMLLVLMHASEGHLTYLRCVDMSVGWLHGVEGIGLLFSCFP
jgi:hypothetical protein